MRFNREIMAVVVLVLIFVLGGLMLGGGKDTQSRRVGENGPQDPSIYNDRASGSKGCYDWVGALGYRPEAWRESWKNLGYSKASLLLVIDPRAQESVTPLTGDDDDTEHDRTLLSASDAADLQDWLRRGNTAVLMSSRLPSGRTVGEKGGDETFADAMDLVAETAATSVRTEFSPLQPLPEMRGVLSIHSESDARLRRRAPDALCLFGDRSGPVVLVIPVGKGHLIAIADSGFASNRNLLRSENAAFLGQMITEALPAGGRVLFDEYHHGDVQMASGATLWTALGRPLQLALVQIALAVVLLVGVVAVRFGLPQPLGRGQTRTSTEYVNSLAGLYRRAQASPAALETIYRQFLRDLSAHLALAPDVSLEQLADSAARQGGMGKDALRRLLATCEQRIDSGQVTEAEVLDLTRQMEAVRKDTGLA